MGAVTEIHVALETRLSTIPGIDEIAWPNSSYTPAPGTLYLRPHNIPVTPLAIGIADADDQRRDGFFQVDVLAPKDAGAQAALAAAEKLDTLFQKGTEILTTSGYKIKVNSVTVETGSAVGSHYVIPVLIQYVAVTP